MIFENDCGCIVDYEVLEKAITEECHRRGFEPKDHYKIYLYRGYAGVSIKHDKVSVHRIIGKYMVGYDFGTEICVHHIDGNKLNNNVSNLQVLRNSLHTKGHELHQYVSKEHKKGFGNRAKDIISRRDVTKEKIVELMNNGLSIPQVAKELNCGHNTVYRRLGLKKA